MPPPYLILGSTFGADYLAVGAAIGLELRTTGEHEYLHTQLFTGFMYIAASLCTFLLRGWKISANDTDVVEAGELDSESSAPEQEPEPGSSPKDMLRAVVRLERV